MSSIHLTSAFQGIGTCATTAYVSWHNIDTGARGDITVKPVGSWCNSARTLSGPGHVELTVTTQEFVHSSDSVRVEYVIPGQPESILPRSRRRFVRGGLPDGTTHYVAYRRAAEPRRTRRLGRAR